MRSICGGLNKTYMSSMRMMLFAGQSRKSLLNFASSILCAVSDSSRLMRDEKKTHPRCTGLTTQTSRWSLLAIAVAFSNQHTSEAS